MYHDPLGQERNLAWNTLTGLKKSVFSRNLSITGREGSIPLGFLTTAEQDDLLIRLFEMWRSRNPHAAKKNAFDFIDHQRGFAWLMLFMSSCFFLPLGYIMLQDSVSQWDCNRLLQKNAQWTTAQVTETKKKRKGHYVLSLEFNVDGSAIKAADQFFTQTAEATPPTSLPILYSPEQPSCWILSKPDEAIPQAHWQKRKFFATYLSLLGVLLGSIGLSGLAWSLFRFAEKNPHKEKIQALFQLR